MIPQSFDEWYYCITAQCGIDPDAEFINSRINKLLNKQESYTANFIQLYGLQHYENVLSWFQAFKAQKSL